MLSSRYAPWWHADLLTRMPLVFPHPEALSGGSRRVSKGFHRMSYVFPKVFNGSPRVFDGSPRVLEGFPRVSEGFPKGFQGFSNNKCQLRIPFEVPLKTLGNPSKTLGKSFVIAETQGLSCNQVCLPPPINEHIWDLTQRRANMA